MDTEHKKKAGIPGLIAGMLLVSATVAGFAFGTNTSFSADDFFARFLTSDSSPDAAGNSEAEFPAGAFTFKQLENHPDNLHGAYANTPRLGFAGDSLGGNVAGAFKDLLSIYKLRQSVDDNFTLRAIDMRSGGLLDIVTLDSLRMQYENAGQIDWKTVDVARRQATREVVDSLESEGVDRDAIAVKWGRKNQVLEARHRELPFIEYEVELARYFDLSLLATEIGTVETFNLDRVVSRVGARSRYQIMPSVLRDFGINHYRLETKSGATLRVYEEWHPLLTMEVSMILVRAYSNAVGHEIPGISAYHAGPFNIFHIYRTFLREKAGSLRGPVTTELAYLWGITAGFDDVRKSSSFRGYSRGYIPTGYGSLRTVEDVPVDTSKTVLVERLQLSNGSRIYLSELLSAVDSLAEGVSWRAGPDDSTLYLKFRTLNPHFNLPAPEDAIAYTPGKGDVLLVRSARSEPVRFFLPLGTSEILSARGYDIFDKTATFNYSHGVFGDVLSKEPTKWDREYQKLVDEAYHFRFSPEHRERLYEVVSKFEELAEINPSFYRKAQLAIVRQHLWIWRSREFTSLLDSIDDARLAQHKPRRVLNRERLPSLSPQPVESPVADQP